MKKGAMFGLDARIALAIFGALSVITGAALYSAIQNAKMTAMYENLVEIEKAFESYYLDTGVKGNRGITLYDIGVLQKNLTPPVAGWKGPYLAAGSEFLQHRYLFHPYFGRIIVPGMLASYKENTFPCDTSVVNGVAMDYYIQVDELPDNIGCNGDLSFLKKLHDKFDHDEDYKRGKLRVIEHSTNVGKGGIFYKLDLLEVRS